jgi:hypothetical protein
MFSTNFKQLPLPYRLLQIYVGTKQTVLCSSVVDRQIFDAHSDPDPNFLYIADPDPDWHQNHADPHAKSENFVYIRSSASPH